MGCVCESYQCLTIRYNPCSEGAQLDIESTETGIWSAQVEFNGVWFDQQFEVTDGEKIIVNNIFNPNYIHEVRIFNVAEELVGCYKADTIMTTNATYNPSMAGDVQPYSIVFMQAGDVTSYQNDDLIGATILDITIDSINQTAYAFDSTTGTITINIFDNQSVFILYKK